MAVLLGECFDGGFAIDHGGHDFAFFGVLLGTDYDKVAIADGQVDHGISYDLEEEELALTYEGLGEWVDLFDMLFGGDWTTCGDTTHQRDVDSLFGLNGTGIIGISDFKGTALGCVLADKAFIDQGFDLILDRCGGGEASCLADLSHGWGMAVGEDRLLDHVEDQLLAGGEAIGIGGAIGQF